MSIFFVCRQGKVECDLNKFREREAIERRVNLAIEKGSSLVDLRLIVFHFLFSSIQILK